MDLLVLQSSASPPYSPTLVNLFLLPSANLLTCFQASGDLLLQVSCVLLLCPQFKGIFLACGHRLLIPFAGFNGFNRCCGIASPPYSPTLMIVSASGTPFLILPYPFSAGSLAFLPVSCPFRFPFVVGRSFYSNP